MIAAIKTTRECKIWDSRPTDADGEGESSCVGRERRGGGRRRFVPVPFSQQEDSGGRGSRCSSACRLRGEGGEGGVAGCGWGRGDPAPIVVPISQITLKTNFQLLGQAEAGGTRI